MRQRAAWSLGLAGILMLAPLGVPQAGALDKPAAVCQARLGKALYAFKKAKMKAWSTCLDAMLLGKPCDEAARTAAIDAAAAGARAKIEAACNAAVLFDPAPAGAGFAQSCQLKTGALSPAEQMCAALPASTPGELADCLTCWKKVGLDTLLEAHYPCLGTTIPDGAALPCANAPSSCPDPLVAKDEVRCLSAIGRASGKWFLKAEKFLEKCLNARRSGKTSDACPDAATSAKLAALQTKAENKIAAICEAMPGSWTQCSWDTNAPCDTLVSIGELGDCVTGGAELVAEDLVCQQYPDADSDGIACPSTCVASGPDDICNGLDDDCDGDSADGSEDPQLGASCDGADDDMCVEGAIECVDGALACNDATSSTTEQCNGDGVDEDCDGSVDEDFLVNDNPLCSSGVHDLGSIAGDSGAGLLVDSHFDEEWIRFRLTEDNDGIVNLGASVQLFSPPGSDFDLYVYCLSCGGTLAGSSTNGGTTGHLDTVDVRSDDDFGQADDFDVLVEIRNFQSDFCANWSLTVNGNTAAPAETCP